MDPELRALKLQLSAQVRPLLEGRDGKACRACGEACDAQVAHVTSARAFCHRMGWTPEAIRESYRLDNLVLLCKPCHGAQTLGAGKILRASHALSDPAATPFERALAQNRLLTWDLRDASEAARRQRLVASLFGKIWRERGWQCAVDVVRGRNWWGEPVARGLASPA